MRIATSVIPSRLLGDFGISKGGALYVILIIIFSA